MWRRIKQYLLKKIYRLLIVRVSFVHKSDLRYYERLKVFCQLPLYTNKGIFTFVFKEDRRKRPRVKVAAPSLLSSYFVELICPYGVDQDNVFTNKVIVVVKMRGYGELNYEALASVLLDLYIDNFSSGTQITQR